MMFWLLIGLLAGSLIGIGGIGGGIVSIPLFMNVLGYSAKEATIYSLVVVAMASAFNSFFQRDFKNWRLAFIIVFFSTISSFFLAPVKSITPDFVILLFVLFFAFSGLVKIWRQKHSPTDTQAFSPKGRSVFLQCLILGVSVGAIATMTGLAGGIVLVPFSQILLGLSLSQAISMTFLITLFSSLLSVVLQLQYIEVEMPYFHLVLLAIGAWFSAWSLKRFLIAKLRGRQLFWLRRLLFSAVVVFAIYSFVEPFIQANPP